MPTQRLSFWPDIEGLRGIAITDDNLFRASLCHSMGPMLGARLQAAFGAREGRLDPRHEAQRAHAAELGARAR